MKTNGLTRETVEAIRKHWENSPDMVALCDMALSSLTADEWQKAVIDWLVIDYIYSKEHDNDPRKAIGDIVKYETRIALDPAVSSDAQALIDKGRMEGAFCRMQNNGEAMSDSPLIESSVERIPFSGCWIWTKRLQKGGYGMVGPSLAHRRAFLSKHGAIPSGLELDHLCRVRCCVNPDHLEPVTRRENQLRGISFSAVNAKKTHCIKGHEYTASNTRIKKDGTRDCRTCTKERMDTDEYRKRDAARKRKDRANRG